LGAAANDATLDALALRAAWHGLSAAKQDRFSLVLTVFYG
jgi:hypothetical protein